MADVEDKEKAEKLAAAKKRFEQLKKQQQKGKKGAKKKADKGEGAEAKEEKEEAAVEASADAEAEAEIAAEGTTEEPKEEDKSDEALTKDDEAAAAAAAEETAAERPAHTRKPSQSEQSRQRSASFRQNSASLASPGALKSPTLPSISAEDEVQDIYRKQASRIDELDKENKTLKDAQAKLQKVEDELEQLRESSGDVAELKSKAALADKRQEEIDKLTSDLTSVQRQLSQAQQQAADKRRKSNASPSRDAQAQLAAKTSTIESLELELSNLRNQYNMSQATLSTHEATIKELQERATTAEQAAETARHETETLKEALSKPAESEVDDAEDPAALQQKINLLESDLRSAQASADTATTRAASLEQKIETLTKLHKDQSTSHDKEIKDLTSKLATLQMQASPASKHDADGIDDDAEDMEREKLHQRIRDLEAETFELRRGVWRDQRAALQPAMVDDQPSPGYEDVDLSNPYAPPQSRPHTRTSSSFQDVLQSGINAFTGRERKQSLGLLSEEGFDEDAFAQAQQEEGKKRIERIREVKRGLENWKGWRVDLVDLRNGGLSGVPTGPLFEA